MSVFQGRVGDEYPHERIERMASAGRCKQRVHHQLANHKSTSDRTGAIKPSLDEFSTVKSLKNNAYVGCMYISEKLHVIHPELII